MAPSTLGMRLGLTSSRTSTDEGSLLMAWTSLSLFALRHGGSGHFDLQEGQDVTRAGYPRTVEDLWSP
jgi:hypothetical protein